MSISKVFLGMLLVLMSIIANAKSDERRINNILTGINKNITEHEVDVQLDNLMHMSEVQRKYLLQSYLNGSSSDTNMGLGLAAICWQESSLGANLCNPNDCKRTKYTGSYGPYQASINTVMHRHNLHGMAMANRIKHKLLVDPDFAKNEAIAELSAWNDYWGSKKVTHKWAHVIASYNVGGKSIYGSNGKVYLTSIIIKTRAIDKFFKMNNYYVNNTHEIKIDNPRVNEKFLYSYVKEHAV